MSNCTQQYECSFCQGPLVEFAKTKSSKKHPNGRTQSVLYVCTTCKRLWEGKLWGGGLWKKPRIEMEIYDGRLSYYDLQLYADQVEGHFTLANDVKLLKSTLKARWEGMYKIFTEGDKAFIQVPKNLINKSAAKYPDQYAGMYVHIEGILLDETAGVSLARGG